MRIKLDPADRVFSQYIRKRDGKCLRCGSIVQFNDKGLPITHQNSHYYGRGKESTRFDPENCDTLCHGCHQYWGSTYREDYRNFKIEQLGKARFDALTLRANSYKKKDRKMALIEAKALLESLC